MEPLRRENGWVQSFNDEKGFGFLRAEDGQAIFVHRNSIMCPPEAIYDFPLKLYRGEMVSFYRQCNDKKNPAARFVTGLGDYPALCFSERARAHPPRIEVPAVSPESP